MSLKKRKNVLFAFVVIIIVVLMFSVVGIVVLYLGGTEVPQQGNVADLSTFEDEDYVIFQDPTIVVDDEEYIDDTADEGIIIEEDEATDEAVEDSDSEGTDSAEADTDAEPNVEDTSD